MKGLLTRSGIRIINITPVEMNSSRWLCLAFEEKDVDMGDAMHLAFMYSDDIKFEDNLMNVAESIFSKSNAVPILRIHSECLLGDALHSDLCDCGEQLTESFKVIDRNKSGIILYLRQEGRGIGMRAKLACLAAQEGYINGIRSVEPMSSDEANTYFGFGVDERQYSVVTGFLKMFSIKNVKMMTGNYEKIDAVKKAGTKIQGLSDINRRHIKVGSRKYRELIEKSKRHYNYILG